MRTGTALCYVSFDFRDGLFTQISSELSREMQDEMGFGLDDLDWGSGASILGGLPLTQERSTMCAPPILGAKSGNSQFDVH